MRPASRRAVSATQPRNARAGSARPANNTRHASGASRSSRHNAAATLSPTNSTISAINSRSRSPIAGTKRKERDFELEGEETNINVVVRCRGRNDREVRENSGIVASTEGARGKTVDLSMGPNALSNKTYHFDKVFSPAADQAMVYDDVVAPILEEMISGYNCTIFAYGQTGTGKTYTMSGDMTDTLGLLSDAAGIIPRTLYSLFRKLEAEETENTVKISFIELYNEELRDLLASDDSTKLKMFEADQKKGHSATIVQGMEESHISSAQEGVRLLQKGSHKRQVAATNCNDLSSRSHTVFTVTVYAKRATESEDWIVSGKLNLVDLAGSENIQRSGAENKRAAEAGLINKSLLTLGRVINALVDKGAHIPYRESKLTRLLQDSLGGRTKTCIIATISPAKSNLEETISTLDYAFRAKNIRNKPQVNQPIPKKTLLREYTAEIQQLKSELIATRQRNGVYLSNDHYEQITVESESRRILSEEQKAKIETMEANLRNKIQDLFSLTNNLSMLKKDNETTKQQLEETSDILKQTELVLADTQENLEEETTLRKAHQKTEEELGKQGATLLSTLERTVEDVNGLRAKIRRKSEIQSVNRNHWQSSQNQIIDATKLVSTRITDYQTSNQQLITDFSTRLQAFVEQEKYRIAQQEKAAQAAIDSFETRHSNNNEHSAQAQQDMGTVLEEIKVLREEVKRKVGAGLEELSAAAGRISAGVIEELGGFHSQLNSSYRALGKEMKSVFDDINKRLKNQKQEAEELREQLFHATQAAQEANAKLVARLDQDVATERVIASTERQSLLGQITDLINASGLAQERRMLDRHSAYETQMKEVGTDITAAKIQYSQSMDAWLEQEIALADYIAKARDQMKKKLQTDWETVEKHSTTIEATAKSVHGETVQIVDAQVKDMATQMQALDDFVARAKLHNEQQHASQFKVLEKLAADASQLHAASSGSLPQSRQALQNLETDLELHQTLSAELISDLLSGTQQPLSELRDSVASSKLTEYVATGSTPQRTMYNYPKVLARTAAHAKISGKWTPEEQEPLIIPVSDLMSSSAPASPSKANIYTDSSEHTEGLLAIPRPATAESLRELPVNIAPTDRERESKTEDLGKSLSLGLSASLMGPPLFKRGVTVESAKSTLVAKGVKNVKVLAEGRENTVPGVVRLSASVGSGGRRLRSNAPQE